MMANEFVVELENKPGQLAELCEALGNQNINIKAIATDRMGNQNFIRLLVDNDKKMRELLEDADLVYAENTVVVKTLGDKPNALTEITRKLGAGGVNIDAIYLLNRSAEKVNLVFALDNPKKGSAILKN